MHCDNAIAAVLIAEDGLIDKLELDERICISDRNFLAMYQVGLTGTAEPLVAAKNSRPAHDLRFADILKRWMQFIQKEKA